MSEIKNGDIIIRLEKKGSKLLPQTQFNRSLLAKKGVWVLLGKTADNRIVCLNVGKSTDIGREILYDLSCLTFVNTPDNSNRDYINQFGEYCGFQWNTDETQECLYPNLAAKYDLLVFMLAYTGKDSKVNGEMEYYIAHEYHALYWRNGKAFQKRKRDSFEEKRFEKIEDFKEKLITFVKEKQLLCECQSKK